ncbi:Uncharacterized protein OS=Chlorobium limicola (strain DSM 245 / NBRC 103803) GN=Clim_1847 PE=4 SV=1: O-antigen_lig [Gemmataceae bacterium]|nr:Uncharacterized protein OS=Chlorobium limicola (strain DSM 245 / NBRC 103803) GN=Clim_1847 PE=4 SV=1: O-antigen_lig [Gemmataceae bacterium]VTU01964.1 Uncharacterized protein OS=Chlorobium limicola (strain DSM 245 / NBRC 103803) GN=Clim_1847 PE=4 SV=1: O-antigen_lig [Gemmataceae bacterium]
MMLLGRLAILAAVLGSVLLVRRYPGHRTVIGVYVVGTLFLPEYGAAEYIEGVPRPIGVALIKLTKENAVGIGLVAGSVLFDARRWLAARPRWFDLPMLAWCGGAVVTALANSLVYDDPISGYVPVGAGPVSRVLAVLDYSDLYEGLVQAAEVTLAWGLPYLLARLYVTDAAKLRDLVLAVVIGAAAYAPLCLLETAVSPQLHRWVYGFHQHEFGQSIRFSGYRPMVFMEHGLAVGFWMVAGAVAAVWLRANGALGVIPLPGGRRVSGLWVAVGLGLVAVACKSTGALVLGAVALAALFASRAAGRSLPIALVLCAAPAYCLVRTQGVWDVNQALALVDSAVGADRAQSLEFRFQNESVLVARALERPIVGWGGWGRSRVYDEYGRATTVADGMWIIVLGKRGIIGLVTLGVVLIMPVALVLVRHGARLWTDPAAAPTAAAAAVLAVYSIDCVLNAMFNPVYVLVLGALVALRRDAPAPAPPADAPAGRWRVKPARPVSRLLRRPRRA